MSGTVPHLAAPRAPVPASVSRLLPPGGRNFNSKMTARERKALTRSWWHNPNRNLSNILFCETRCLDHFISKWEIC